MIRACFEPSRPSFPTSPRIGKFRCSFRRFLARRAPPGLGLTVMVKHPRCPRRSTRSSRACALVDLGFTKADVRAGAAAVGLGVWDKPAAACLSSRIPYGTSVTRERLAQIGGFEAAIKALGFRQVRVRWHDAIARIELGEEE